MKRREKGTQRSQIISEYLTGDETYLSLSAKYGVNARTIQSWVRSYRGRKPGVEVAPAGDERLKKRLEQSELKNELLEEILRLSEELTGIDLRKKFGSGQ